MNIKTMLLVLLLSPLAFSAWAAEPPSAYDRVIKTGTVRCGFIPWPPGYEIDPNTNEVKGISKELFEGIIKLAGWKTQFVETSLAALPLDLEHGKIDAVCGDGPWTLTNIKVVDYTTPAIYTPVVIYVRANDNRFKAYADFDQDKVTFVGIDGDTSVDLAMIRFPKAKVSTLINLTDPAQMLLNVADGKADAVIIDPYTGESFNKNNLGRLKAFSMTTPLAVYPFGMSVKRGEFLLQNTLSRATEMAINIGLVDQKADQYDPTHKIVYPALRPYAFPTPEKEGAR